MLTAKNTDSNSALCMKNWITLATLKVTVAWKNSGAQGFGKKAGVYQH